tara:strand:+ start:77 stop:445 length:369 start_codon:yes stop_codon:yes gene_type:complete
METCLLSNELNKDYLSSPLRHAFPCSVINFLKGSGRNPGRRRAPQYGEYFTVYIQNKQILIFKDQFCEALTIDQCFTELILKNQQGQQPQHIQHYTKHIKNDRLHLKKKQLILKEYIQTHEK